MTILTNQMDARLIKLYRAMGVPISRLIESTEDSIENENEYSRVIVESQVIEFLTMLEEIQNERL